MPNENAREAMLRRREAARKFQPKRIRLLLIAEAPPVAPAPYFYEMESGAEPLFDGVCEVMFEEKPDPASRPAYLAALKRRGAFAIELDPEGKGEGAGDADRAAWLVIRCQELDPEKIVLVGARVESAGRRLLEKAKLPVLPVSAPDPAKDPIEFRRELRRAVVKAGLEALIRPLPQPKRKKLD